MNAPCKLLIEIHIFSFFLVHLFFIIFSFILFITFVFAYAKTNTDCMTYNWMKFTYTHTHTRWYIETDIWACRLACRHVENSFYWNFLILPSWLNLSMPWKETRRRKKKLQQQYSRWGVTPWKYGNFPLLLQNSFHFFFSFAQLIFEKHFHRMPLIHRLNFITNFLWNQEADTHNTQ